VRAQARVHELDKVPAGDEGGGDLEASRIGMLLYSCIWGDDQPLNPGLPTSFAQRDAESKTHLLERPRHLRMGRTGTLHSLPDSGVHLEPQEKQRYDVIHAPNTVSAESHRHTHHQAYQPHLSVGLVPAGCQDSCHQAQADIEQQATAVCAETRLWAIEESSQCEEHTRYRLAQHGPEVSLACGHASISHGRPIVSVTNA
jgi:hypothetical protein